jgi:hypothetical protein
MNHNPYPNCPACNPRAPSDCDAPHEHGKAPAACEYGCAEFPCYDDKCDACRAAIDASEDAREAHKEALAASDYDPVRDGPLPGTYAYTARCLVEMGIMDGDEADRWKDEMKDRMFDD